MAIKEFEFETQEYRDYLAANPDNKFDRFPEKIVVYTGADIPPDDLQPPVDGYTIEEMRAGLIAMGHPKKRIDAWVSRYE